MGIRVRSAYARVMKLMLTAFLACVVAQSASRSGDLVVRPGIEVLLAEVPQQLRGTRVGLITNHAGIDRAGNSAIDLIAAHKDLKLAALFAAEHGIRGTAAAGERVADDRDAKTGVSIFSLYQAEDRGPTPAMLDGIDGYEKVQIGRALVESLDPRGLEIIDQVLRGPVDIDRVDAAIALARINPASAGQTIVETLTRGSPAVRSVALYAAGLVRIGAEPAVYRRLGDGEEMVRAFTVEAITNTFVPLPAQPLPLFPQ